ncbi:short chain enoyl-CoA hydratase [Rhodococcus rhodochrous J45]|uniref:Short chain enoyl-CoA hydratase n=2 Tax=Rhodococcus rhodochrous TaxID=1829 RepID=A0A562DKV7_RHORH|nr:short chain enoyl-CoA hydratase [Rhodococcus rhodochrous J45]
MSTVDGKVAPVTGAGPDDGRDIVRGLASEDAHTAMHDEEKNVVLLRRDGPVGVITLNRPRVLNAVNAVLSDALGAVLDEIDRDPGLRVGVLTGAGRAFCAGADLKAFADGGSVLPTNHPEWGFAGLVQHYVSKPLIAAVNGVAVGGGTEIVLACDLAVLSSEATLGLPEVKRGLIAGGGGLIRLPGQMPAKIAAHAIFTGEPVSAEAALRWGLVNSVVQPSEVLPEALRLAHLIAANAPVAVRASKKIMSHAQAAGLDDRIWQVNSAESDAVCASEDALEGASAFTEKRPPVWRNR